MKMKCRILTIILTLVSPTLFGQTKYKLTGTITDCSDSVPLMLGVIYLKQNDSILQKSFTNSDGEFELKNLSPGNYQILTDYYYYPTVSKEIKIVQDTIVTLCLKGNNPDSLLTSYQIRPNYIIYYYGMPVYSDEDLNDIGKKYGVKYQNLGCVVRESYDKYNDIIKRILIKRNGVDWEKKFWSEVEQKHDN